ncbi:MAG: uridylate kinase [Bacteroides sp. SM23_62]|nr:MAG: uridylate kinase [Bacteroides sp. SM23_62]
MLKYKRILLKLSGESLAGETGNGIDPPRLKEYVEQIKEIADMGVEVGIVIGGGNIFRGLSGAAEGFDRVKGDYMGMLATVINGLAIQSGLESIGARATMFTAIEMKPVGIRFSKPQVLDALGNGYIAIFTFGTGNPYFTTDTAASLRAVEIKADALLKGTRVDGVYSADPEKNPTATRFNEISFEEAIRKDLKVMDQTAFIMCRENQLPIIVFNMNEIGNLKRIIQGERLGTLVKI